MVRGNAAVQVAPGAVLALSALALIGTLLLTSMAGHVFASIEDPVAGKIQRVQLAENLAMVGGLVLAVADQSGLSSHGAGQAFTTPRRRACR